MKQFFSIAFLSRPFGLDHSCHFVNRREKVSSKLTVRFRLHFGRGIHAFSVRYQKHCERDSSKLNTTLAKILQKTHNSCKKQTTLAKNT